MEKYAKTFQSHNGKWTGKLAESANRKRFVFQSHNGKWTVEHLEPQPYDTTISAFCQGYSPLMSYDMLIEEEIRKLVRYFRHGDQYKAFRQVR